MKRREFLQASAVAATGIRAGRSSAAETRAHVLQNAQLAWHLEASDSGIRPVLFENRITGRRYDLRAESEFALVFSEGERFEIPWWHFQLTDAGGVLPDSESGLARGYDKLDLPVAGWKPVRNLAGGQQGHAYTGYGWFRHEFALPAEARGKELVWVLGGYDEQDWNQHWVYVNGTEIGQRAVSGRWRRPGRHTIRPGDAAYATLAFGPQSRNLLAVRARGYDFHIDGVSEEALDQYVFRPFLFDQFLSAGEPYLRVSRFKLASARQESAERLSLVLQDAARELTVTAHYQLDGFVRRKWLEIRNESARPRLLLDVELDVFEAGAKSEGGGHGKPVFLERDSFCAVEHPAGINQGGADGVRLWHCPGRSIPPGGTLRTLAAVVAAAPQGRALDQFHDYLLARSPRRQKGRVSIFTCFGTNNQWGACPTLNDVQVLDDQQVIKRWQQHGVKLDFFTLDTGWPANDGDLTEFVNTCYPDGPARMLDGIHQLGMKFGLWFSEGWGPWANGTYAPIQPGAIPEPGESATPPSTPPVGVYRNGYPVGGGVGRQMCMASEPYHRVFRDAILHHVSHNQARLLKFDSGSYYCNSTSHGHLPGKYSTEAISDRMIGIVEAARALAPDVFVMWYWGEGSPFWALHGDVISESGLLMEGSGTAQFPALYYRDSVTLSLDQNTQFANLIPPMNKDSLGIWLSQIRWGNFMGRERWREALVMDLGRGSLVFPQLWGDPNLLGDDDLQFLAGMIALARANDRLLRRPRRTFGDAWKNEPYGYAFGEGGRSLIFCHNMHFGQRPLPLALNASLGLSAPAGTPLRMTAHFPEPAELRSESGSPFQIGNRVALWMRPFETMLLEVGSGDSVKLPERRTGAARDEGYGHRLELAASPPAPWMAVKFADAARLERAALKLQTQYFSARLPALSEGRHMLAIAVKLSRGGKDYRYSPVVAEIVQLRGRLADREIGMIPVPDARRFGNTQHAGCSWVLYKIPLASRHSGEPLAFAVHAYLPDGVEARTEAWIVKQWWQESGRPEPDGFFGDSPS
ncbi:MAG TPA: hypothetical protein DEQ47_03805 [Solibacterales bacterium]|nr:hypothetical protein [Bryobacterales bacterium]